MIRFKLFGILTFICLNSQGQIGGKGVFAIPRMPASARQLAWTGYNVSYANRDATNMLQNPALMQNETVNRPCMNMNFQVPGVWNGNAAMSFNYKGIVMGGSASFINFGNIDGYDAGGNPTGTETANETMLTFSVSKLIKPRLYFGATLRGYYSILGPSIGNGIGLDAGVYYKTKDEVASFGATINNFGTMIARYNEYEKLPVDMRVGVTIKPKHMPFRFNITFHNLLTYDLTYSQYLKNNTIFGGGASNFNKPANFGEKVMRHFVFGGELVLGKNFGILIGYNYQRRKELAPEIKRGVTGLGWGIDLKLNRFNLTYGSAALFPGFNTNMFSVSALLDDFKKKKEKPKA